jgi:hypothetical protein
MSTFDDIPTTMTIDLGTPISFDGREYGQVILREPRIGEVRIANEQLKNGITAAAAEQRNMHLIAKVSGLPFPVVEQLPISIANKATAYLSVFINSAG